MGVKNKMKKDPKLSQTMTTKEVLEVVRTISSPLAASKWLKRNKITEYPINSRVSVWDRSEVMRKVNGAKQATAKIVE